MSHFKKIENKLIVNLKNIKVLPKELYRGLSNSKQVTSGLTNRNWWKKNVKEFVMWSTFKDDSIDVTILLNSMNMISELDLKVRLKRICGIQCEIEFKGYDFELPKGIMEFKYYNKEEGEIHPLEILKEVNEGR